MGVFSFSFRFLNFGIFGILRTAGTSGHPFSSESIKNGARPSTRDSVSGDIPSFESFRGIKTFHGAPNLPGWVWYTRFRKKKISPWLSRVGELKHFTGETSLPGLRSLRSP